MNITEVRVFPVTKGDEKLKAFATITLDNCFVVRDLKIIHGSTGLFIAMPSRKKKDGTYADVAHPLDSGTRHAIEEAVISEYQRTMDGNTPGLRELPPVEQRHGGDEQTGEHTD
jgi:stage V sporulation protein G